MKLLTRGMLLLAVVICVAAGQDAAKSISVAELTTDGTAKKKADVPTLTAEQKEPYITAAWTYNSLLAQQLSINAQLTQALQQLQLQEAILKNKCGDKAELTGLDRAKPACSAKPTPAAKPDATK